MYYVWCNKLSPSRFHMRWWRPTLSAHSRRSITSRRTWEWSIIPSPLPLHSRTTSCKGAHCQSSLSWSVDPPCCPNVHSMWGLRPHSSKQKVPTLYPILNTYSYTSSVCKCSRSRFVFRGRSRWHLIRLRYYSVLPFFYVFRRWLVGLSSVFLFLRVFK